MGWIRLVEEVPMDDSIGSDVCVRGSDVEPYGSVTKNHAHVFVQRSSAPTESQLARRKSTLSISGETAVNVRAASNDGSSGLSPLCEIPPLDLRHAITLAESKACLGRLYKLS